MPRRLFAPGLSLLALVGCGDATPTAPTDGGVDAPAIVDQPSVVDLPAADVVEKPTDTGRVIPACTTPLSGDGGVAVRGRASPFGTTGGDVHDAVVTVLEHPGWCARTAADGTYELTGFTPGEHVNLVLDHPDYWPIQNGTLVVPSDGASLFGFQAPTVGIFRVLAQYLRITPDPDRCQIATTVVARGFTGYDPGGHGEVGVTVTIDPPLPAEAGPVYFRYLGPSAIVPARELTETSLDGGLVFVNVPPGDYVLTAHKTGVVFTQVAIHCRAGLLINPSPPWSIQAQ